jgi:two-component system, NtrC family, sensor kinase
MDEKKWLQHEVGVFYEIIQAINSDLGQQDVLNVLLERIVTTLGYRAATIRLLDQERQRLDLKAAYGLSEEYLQKGNVDLNKRGIDQKVITGEQVSVAELGQETRFQYADAAIREGLVSMLAVPLGIPDRVIGVLHLYTSEVHDFSPEEKAFVSAIADLGAQAIQRSRLFDAFLSIVQNVNSSLDLKEVLSKLLSISVAELNVKAGSIRLLGPKRETLHLAASTGLSQQYIQKGAVKIAQSSVDQRVLQEGKPVVADLAEQAGIQYPEEAQREGIHLVFVLPLRVKDTMIGVIRFYSGKIRKFTREEMNFAIAVADIGAIAIENAKLHEVMKQRLAALKEDVDGWYQFLAFS